MFTLRDKQGKLRGLMIVHVDDVMYCHDGGELGKQVEQDMTNDFLLEPGCVCMSKLLGLPIVVKR